MWCHQTKNIKCIEAILIDGHLEFMTNTKITSPWWYTHCDFVDLYLEYRFGQSVYLKYMSLTKYHFQLIITLMLWWQMIVGQW